MGKFERLPTRNIAISKFIGSGGYPSTVNGLKFFHWLIMSQSEQLIKIRDMVANGIEPYAVFDLADFKEFFGIKAKDNKRLWEGIYDVTGCRIEEQVNGASRYTSIFVELVMPYSMSSSSELKPNKNNKVFIKDKCISAGYPYSQTSFLIRFKPDIDILNEFVSPNIFTIVDPIVYKESTSVNNIQFYLRCAGNCNLKNGFAWNYFEMIHELSAGFRGKTEEDRRNVAKKYREKPSEFKKKVLRPLIEFINAKTDLRVQCEERKYEAILKVYRAKEINEEGEIFKKRYSGTLKVFKINPLSLVKKLDPGVKPFVDSILVESVNRVKAKLIYEGNSWKHKHSRQSIENISAYASSAITNEMDSVLDEKAVSYSFEEYLADKHIFNYMFEEEEFLKLKNSFFSTMKSKGLMPRDLFKKLMEEAKLRGSHD